MQAQSILLEPYYDFTLELPDECVGRAMSDIQRMNGTDEPPSRVLTARFLTGTAPVSTMRNYWTEVAAYTKGRGRLSCTPDGYAPCHNAEEVILPPPTIPTADVEKYAGFRVLLSHGAGYVVKWDEVPGTRMRIPQTCLNLTEEEPEKVRPVRSSGQALRRRLRRRCGTGALFERTYGPVKNRGFEAFQQSRKEGRDARAAVRHPHP